MRPLARIHRRNAALATLIATAWPFIVRAQAPRYVIGTLSLSVPADDPLFDSMRIGLRDLGYAESRDYRVEHRWAEGHADRLPLLADELMRLNASVIVATTQP